MMTIDEIIKKIDQEIESQDAGHDAYKQTQNHKSFSREYLENCYAEDPANEDQGHKIGDDHMSTFDEANYNPIKDPLEE